jgi:hypothetical protein
MPKFLKQLIFLASITVAAIALIDQLGRPEAERTWHGTVAGIPYDFRPPTVERIKNAWWNPDDPRLFTPREFGVGWAVNLARLYELIMSPQKHNGDG